MSDWMWRQALELFEELERRHRRIFYFLWSKERFPIWHPPIDLLEEEEELRLFAILPGVDPTTLEVVLEGGVVKLSGERPPPVTSSTRNIHRLEIPYGRFERRIPLPPGRYRLTESRYQKGCLELRFQKVG